MSEARVFVGFPFYEQANPGAVTGATVLASKRPEYKIRYQPKKSSFLINGFNQLWGMALAQAAKGKITHWAMLHSDIVPESYWIDVCMDELEQTGAAVMSVVSPIKDSRGSTSCGIDVDDTGYHVRRLSMHEIFGLPKTFCTADLDKCGIPTNGRGLLINTGCWIADLRHPYWQDIDENRNYKFFFNVRARLFRNDNGEPQTEVESEDWMFSRLLHKYGVPYYATRKVKLMHFGEWPFGNDSEWGTVKDEAFKQGL